MRGAEEAGPSLFEDGVAWAHAQIQLFEEEELEQEALLARIAVLDTSQGAAPPRPRHGLLRARQVQLNLTQRPRDEVPLCGHCGDDVCRCQ